jgi:F-type H+-transporting ATPase subunit epsilon
MADGKIELEIVTPKGRALAAQVDEVTAPSAEGEFGVLPGHLPMVAALRTGIVSYRQGSETKRCAVGTGFAEAGHDKLLILADDYVVRENIDPVVLRKQLSEVQSKLEKNIAVTEASHEVESERRALIDRENWIAAQLELYGDPPPATMRPFEEYGPPSPPIVEEQEGKLEPPGGHMSGSP